MAKKKKLTFFDILRDLKNRNGYENKEEYALDYFSCSDGEEKEPKPYDDFYSITTFGACEGIYTDFYVIRESDRSRERIGCAKTLSESDGAYLMMNQLGALVTLELRKLSIKNSYPT